MNKTELIYAIRERIVTDPLSPGARDIARILDAFAEITHSQLAQGQPAILPGIGKLESRARPARTGRNPQTGEALQIPAKTTAHFTPAKTLRDAINV